MTKYELALYLTKIYLQICNVTQVSKQILLDTYDWFLMKIGERL